jgi:predicted nucleic acid-binding protein
MRIMLDSNVLMSVLLFPDVQTDLLINTITKDYQLVL